MSSWLLNVERLPQQEDLFSRLSALPTIGDLIARGRGLPYEPAAEPHLARRNDGMTAQRA